MDRDRILDRLRALQPAQIVAVIGGEERRIAVGKSGQRGRHERAADAVIACRPQSLELRDAEGAVLEVIAAEAAAAPTLAPGNQLSPEERALASAERIAAMVAKESAAARESVLRETRASQEAYVELLRIVVGRVSQLESVYGKVLQAQYAATVAQAEAAQGPAESETDKMVSSMLPLLAGRLAGGAA
jgi:hypothetical protein